MARELLMGNEAIGLGAVHAGVVLVAGYPGTPSTEILETVAKNNEDKKIHVEWSVNEKAALEVAAGASYAGARTMVTMKQVGLNVASDPLMSLAYIGVEGGMVTPGILARFPSCRSLIRLPRKKLMRWWRQRLPIQRNTRRRSSCGPPPGSVTAVLP